MKLKTPSTVIVTDDGFLKLQGIFVADVFVYLFVFPNWGWKLAQWLRALTLFLNEICIFLVGLWFGYEMLPVVLCVWMLGSYCWCF